MGILPIIGMCQHERLTDTNFIIYKSKESKKEVSLRSGMRVIFGYMQSTQIDILSI